MWDRIDELLSEFFKWFFRIGSLLLILAIGILVCSIPLSFVLMWLFPTGG